MFNPYAILGVLVSLILAVVGGYAKGRIDADRSSTISILERQVDAIKRERDLFEQQLIKTAEIAKAANDRQTETQRHAETLAAEIDEYAKKLSAAGVCSLSDGDDKWLQSIGKRVAPSKGDPSGGPGGLRKTSSDP